MRSDLDSRLAMLAAQVDELSARITQLESEEMPRPPPVEPIFYGPTVPVRGRSVTISGTKARYIWINYANIDNETAEYRSYTQDPHPNGWAIVDTEYLPLHLPRLG